VISIQSIHFLNKERLKWTQAETSLTYAVRNFWQTRCSVKHVCTRPIKSATELPANVHTFTPNTNEMHLQHIRTKRPDFCMLMAGQPVHITTETSARIITTDVTGHPLTELICRNSGTWASRQTRCFYSVSWGFRVFLNVMYRWLTGGSRRFEISWCLHLQGAST